MTVLDVKKIKADAAAAFKRSEKLLEALKKLPIAPSPSPHLSAVKTPAATSLEKSTGTAGANSEKQASTAARLSSAVWATLVAVNVTHRDKGLDILETARYFKEAAVKVAGGDLAKLQEMLAIQSRTLDLVFDDFLIRAVNQTNFDIKEKYFRLAFKAQSQCRTTVESLAVIQQGPAIFARQANITNGPQQVNNAISHDASTCQKPAPVLVRTVIEGIKQLDSVPVNTEQLEPPRMEKQRTCNTNYLAGLL